MATTSSPVTLTFGIYAGSAAGGIECPQRPDQPDQITRALDQLQGRPGRPFVVRAYDVYVDRDEVDHTAPLQTPAGYERYLDGGRALDVVAQYHSRSADIDGYCAFIEQIIDLHGRSIATLQVGEEANVTGDPSLDGAYPRVLTALIAGVRAAKARAGRNGYQDLKVGCNSSPLLGPDNGFFTDLTQAGGERFIADLDYVGLDFFPDVFRPIPAAILDATVEGLLRGHRHGALTAAGLGRLPLIITEHGWPTGPRRSAARQAQVLRAVIDVVARNAEELNITGYTHHALRDTDSAGSGLFSHFGLMTDDYTPKPAFHAYRDMIDTLSR
jgi:hypothetical protein